MSLDTRQLRLLFSDIIRSYTVVPNSSFGTIYIKHLNNIDLAEIDDVYNNTFNRCLAEKIPTHNEKIEYLIQENLWDKKEEDKLKDYKKLAAQYEQNKSNEYLKSKRTIWENELTKINKDIHFIESKKNLLVSETAESFATKESNDCHILLSFYQNKELTAPLFNPTVFGAMEDKKMNEIYDLFNGYLRNFNTQNLKKMGLSNFFLNMFYLAPESVMEFYGKPVIYLSFYQIDLMMWGRYFKGVMSEMGDMIPKDIRDDPDKILEYVELNKNYKKMFPNEKEQEASSIIGANKEDLSILGMQSNANNNLSKKLKEKGQLSIDDLANM